MDSVCTFLLETVISLHWLKVSEFASPWPVDEPFALLHICPAWVGALKQRELEKGRVRGSLG